MMSLENFIHNKFVVLNQNTPIIQATRSICDNYIGCLLVGDKDGNAVGIVTDRDFVCRGLLKNENQKLPIEQIMSHDLIAAKEDSSLSEVIALMEKNGIRRIPIIHKAPDGKKTFSGIITLDDLVAANQIEANQLSRIIQKQVDRRRTHLTEHQTHAVRRSQARSETHREETLHRFYSHFSRSMALEPDVLKGVIELILRNLVMRVTFTTASHFLAQLPYGLREKLLKLPAGPDRAYSGKRMIEELAKQVNLSEEQSCAVFSRFLLGLNEWMGSDSLEKLQAQLPQEFHPFFESAKLSHSSTTLTPISPISKAPLTFSDRTQAAELIVQRLIQYRDKNPLVLGIPRGSVPMAKVIADQLHGDLDVVLVHKIGAPDNPEFAIGSVSEFGTIFRSEAIKFVEVPSNYIEKAARFEVSRLKQRRQTYSPVRPPINPKDRITIIIDDGIATGSTMLAAIRAVRSQSPQKVIVATPVASTNAVELIKGKTDEIVVLKTPEDFFSVSQFYDDFPEVSDAQVLKTLTETAKKDKHQPHGPSSKKTA